jgi:hypothetical protein
MRVVVPPVLVGDRICRIVSPVESLLEVEEWVGAWWAPSGVTLSVVGLAPGADPSMLRTYGVPPTDWVAEDPRPDFSEIESLMRAREPGRGEPMRLDEDVRRLSPPRRRKYPGNARFRRSAVVETEPEPMDGPAQDFSERRRVTEPAPANSPRRRASDLPRRKASDP